jgi:hypothetical protein
MHFGDMIPLRDAARPDATRYRRALVATAYGLEHPDFVGWNESSTTRVGRLTVRVLENPDPVQVHYDFVDHLRPPDATVARVGDPREECAWTTGEFVAGGGLSQGALAPPERFRCTESWNYVGVTYIEDLQHRGRRCLWSHPVGGAAMVTRYARVPLGTLLRGHHGIAYEAERGDDHGQSFAGPDGGPVVLTVRVDDTEVGRSTHVDGEGWKAFEFDTRAYAGTEHAVSFEVRAAFAGMRHYCFEGDTRTPAGSRPSERRR